MIDVLLATYRPNADWLKAQVDSIRVQEGVEVNLIRREDEFGVGACANFSALLGQSRGEYAAFADQDDVWMPLKLAKSLAKMRELEADCGTDTPILVFTDALVTDAGLHPLRGTLLSRQGVDVVRGLGFSRLLMQNFIPGNAMLFNAALRERAGSVPADALMHDIWLALVAAAFGRIGFVNEPLYFYRQHQVNVLGATTAGFGHFLRRAIEGPKAFRRRLQANVVQARAFVGRFGAESPASAVALADLDGKNFFARRLELMRHRLYKHGFPRNMSLLAFA